jgi:hypothetical protein
MLLMTLTHKQHGDMNKNDTLDNYTFYNYFLIISGNQIDQV